MSAYETSRAGLRLLCRRLLYGVGATSLVAGGMLALPGVASAAGITYVVDRGNTSCSDTTGTGTAAAPFCTIGKGVLAAHAGDTVQVKAGSYPETVSMPRDGAAGSPITLAGDPGATITGASGGNGRGISMSGRSYLAVSGFTVTGTPSYGIYIFGGSHVAVTGNDVSTTGPTGSYVAGIFLQANTDSTISGNHSHGNTGPGIQLMPSLSGGVVTLADRITITANETDHNANVVTRETPGIDIRSGTNVVTDNVSHDNEDSGIQFYPGNGASNPATTLGNQVAGNVTYGNGDHGIDDLDATNQNIVGNTVYNNVASGINVEGGSTGATVQNNICVDNGIGSPRTVGNIRLDSTAIGTGTIDSDLVSLKSSSADIVWGTASYPTLAAFKKAVASQETHGLEGDPKFADPANNNFQLTAGSPAIDSADSSAPGELGTDLTGQARVDDPATPDTGMGSRTYDDRGAYEFLNPNPQQSTTTSLTSSASSAAQNTPVTLTATVAAAGSTPTGTVTFLDGTTSLGSSQLAADGTATLTTSTLAVGSHSLTAQYAGDGTSAPSTSPVFTQTITATPPTTGGFTPVAPSRVMTSQTVRAGTAATLKLAGAPNGATAVLLDVTASGSTTTTNVSACTGSASVASCQAVPTLKVARSHTVSHLAVVLLDSTSSVEFVNSAGSVRVSADVQGWFVNGSGSGFSAVPPFHATTSQQVGPGAVAPLSLPAAPAGATAVVLDVTAAGATATTSVSACAGGTSASTCGSVPNLQVTVGQTAANLVVVPLDSAKTVELYNSAGTVRLTADVQGWFVAGSGNSSSPVASFRALTSKWVGARVVVRLTVPNAPANATAVVLNVTAARSTTTTSVSVCAGGRTAASCRTVPNLTVLKGQTVSNLVVVPLGPGGVVEFANSAGSVHVTADVQGWFVG